MNDIQAYIEKRKANDTEFAQNFESGYKEFKIGEMLKQARIEAGWTQEEVALHLKTKKSAISRIENHAQDIKLSTLLNFAKMFGRELNVTLT